MTTPELITDEIVDRTRQVLCYKMQTYISHENTRDILLAIQDDITRPYRNLMQGWKQNSEAYERALKEIRNDALDECSNHSECEFYRNRKRACPTCPMAYHQIADLALKGDYHKTDFTEFCEQNPITEHPT